MPDAPAFACAWVSARRFTCGQLSLQKGFQGDGVVMLRVFGSEQECDFAITRRLQDRLPGLRVGLQFGGVLALELFPPGRVMVEPLAQGSPRGDLLQPSG